MFFFARFCCWIGISLRIQYVRNTLHCVYIVLRKCKASAVWKKEVSAVCVSMGIQSGQKFHGCHTKGPLNVTMQSARFWLCVFN